eukprot:165071_1
MHFIRSWYQSRASFTKKESVLLPQNISNALLIRNLCCILWKRLFISLCKLYQNKESIILLIIFLYFAGLGWTALIPHIADTIHMKLPFREQLHWLLLNAGWRTPYMTTDMNALSNYSVVILGLVKDSQKSLPNLLFQLKIFACSFKYAHFFVLESNSNDNTAQMIKDWGSAPDNCSSLNNQLSHQSFTDYIFAINPAHPLRGIVDKDIFQPKKEFDEVLDVMKKHKSRNPKIVREERYVIYRNYLLDQMNAWYKQQNEDIDYLIWVDMDLRGFDISSIVEEFAIGFALGYDVLCTNGIKYGGWYYDSYATVFANGTWTHGIDRWKITNHIRDYRFYNMSSCFGGLAAYKLEYVLRTQCKYEHFDAAYSNIPQFTQFSDSNMVRKVCEHLPFNFCLYQHGAHVAVATKARSFCMYCVLCFACTKQHARAFYISVM